MNTKAVVAVLIIIILAGGAYFIWGRGGTMEEGAENAPRQIGNGTSLGALVAAGQPVTCTFSTTTAADSTSGTMYIANGMVAGDFTSTGSSAGTMIAHMIVRDQTSYMWTSASPQGFKSSVTPSGATPSQNQGVDYNAQSNYACQPWTPDSNKFNLPTNISFMSTASYTPPAQGAGATGAGGSAYPGGNVTGAPPVKGSAAQCAACNSLPSAQKAQCLAALSC